MFNKKVFDMLKPIKGLKSSHFETISRALTCGQILCEAELAISEVLFEDFKKGELELTDEQWERVIKKIEERRRYFKEQVEKFKREHEDESLPDAIDLEELE